MEKKKHRNILQRAIDVICNNGEDRTAMPVGYPHTTHADDDLPPRERRSLAPGVPTPHQVPPPAPPGTGAFDKQVGGSHYKGMKIQHAEFCQANGLTWCESAAIKYLVRHRNKNKVEDLKKAIHYIQLCAKLEYNEEI